MMRNHHGITYIWMLVGDGLVHGILPAGDEGVLGLVVAVEGRGFLDDVDLGVAVAPHQEVDGLVELAVERGLENERKPW